MGQSAFDRILQQASASKPTNQASSSKDNDDQSTQTQSLPAGVVLDKDGKPCKTCTSGAAWRTMMKGTLGKPSNASTPAPAPTVAPTSDCPPDVEELGRSTWTLLHTMAATYPERAEPDMQSTMKSFISTFSRLYPCWVCAEDFQSWMKEPRNEPQLQGQDELGNWMCRAHNAVNVKLGKPEFDCSLWKQRWKDGWKDGRCD